MTDKHRRKKQPAPRQSLATLDDADLDLATGGAINWRRIGSIAGNAALTLLTTPGVAM